MNSARTTRAIFVAALAWALVSFTPGVAFGAPNLAGMSVFLDPGHSGVSDSSLSKQVPDGRGGTKDCQTTGTSTNDGYSEHAFNWDVANRVRSALEGLGVRTQMSRPDDSSPGPCVDA